MLVVIDGDCSFCQWASRLLKRLCRPGLHIISLREVSHDTLHTWENNPAWGVDSIKVISQNHLYIKSAAVSAVLTSAHWYAQPLRVIFILPTAWLDIAYDWVARHRKGIHCEIS